MTNTQIELIQNSWKMVTAANADTAGTLLYKRLLEIIPELQPALAGRYNKQPSRKLVFAITCIIRRLRTPGQMMSTVENLTRRHLVYPVRDEQYIQAGKSLLQVLANGLGDQWTQATACAWATCFTYFAESMMNASVLQDNDPVYYC